MAGLFACHAAGGCLLFFSEAARAWLGERTGLDLAHCPVLPIGIDLKRARARSADQAQRLKVVSIGRITEFKTYNVKFLEAVATLRRRGVPLEYHVYGDGPAVGKLRRRIAELGLDSAVRLQGTLEYSRFPEAVADAGLFVGSGTALIEAAACGVPALIGIESQPDDLSYGFLHEMSGLAYHESGIPHPKAPFAEHVARVVSLDSDQYRSVCAASIRKAREYSIERLVEGWIELDRRLCGQLDGQPRLRFNRLRFVGSLLFDRLTVSIGRDSGFLSRYDQGLGA
jgi:glycosyltransferase involved in cell wall biosynthesis